MLFKTASLKQKINENEETLNGMKTVVMRTQIANKRMENLLQKIVKKQFNKDRELNHVRNQIAGSKNVVRDSRALLDQKKQLLEEKDRLVKENQLFDKF